MDRSLNMLENELVPQTPAPTSGDGGTINTDIKQMLVLLGNRLTAIENAVAKLAAKEDEQEEPAEGDGETPTPVEEKAEVDEYGDPVVAEEKCD